MSGNELKQRVFRLTEKAQWDLLWAFLDRGPKQAVRVEVRARDIRTAQKLQKEWQLELVGTVGEWVAKKINFDFGQAEEGGAVRLAGVVSGSESNFSGYGRRAWAGGFTLAPSAQAFVIATLSFPLEELDRDSDENETFLLKKVKRTAFEAGYLGVSVTVPLENTKRINLLARSGFQLREYFYVLERP